MKCVLFLGARGVTQGGAANQRLPTGKSHCAKN